MSNTLNWIIFIGLILLLPTAYAAKIGAPYAPTFMAAIKRAFSYISLGPHDVIVDLGAGDGRVLIAAGERGAQGIGYELSPIMWFVVWLRLKFLSLRSGSRREPKTAPALKPAHKIYMRNFFKQKLPPQTTIIFAFLMPEHMAQVKQFLSRQQLPNLRYVLIYAFPFPDLRAYHIIHEPKCSRLYVYNPSEFISNA